jgi:hypothetical protein
MTALLALLATAGYQNRDKIAEWIKTAQRKMTPHRLDPELPPPGPLPDNWVECWLEPAAATC